jgi:hypothetical protein
LPLDDAWLDRIRDVAVRVVGTVARAGGDWFTSQTFDAILLDACAVLGETKFRSPGDVLGEAAGEGQESFATVPKAEGEPNPEPEMAHPPLVQAQEETEDVE